MTPLEKKRRQNPGELRCAPSEPRPEGVRDGTTTSLRVRGGMDDRALLAAADFACAVEVWDRCINTRDRTKTVVDLEQRYPMPFREAVLARAKKIDLDPAYVYGLIRQESRFIMDARSHVGASGLMQVMPATAKWTAKKIGLTDFQPQQITDRDTNIAIGTGYLEMVLDGWRFHAIAQRLQRRPWPAAHLARHRCADGRGAFGPKTCHLTRHDYVKGALPTPPTTQPSSPGNPSRSRRAWGWWGRAMPHCRKPGWTFPEPRPGLA